MNSDNASGCDVVLIRFPAKSEPPDISLSQS